MLDDSQKRQGIAVPALMPSYYMQIDLEEENQSQDLNDNMQQQQQRPQIKESMAPSRSQQQPETVMQLMYLLDYTIDLWGGPPTAGENLEGGALTTIDEEDLSNGWEDCSSGSRPLTPSSDSDSSSDYSWVGNSDDNNYFNFCHGEHTHTSGSNTQPHEEGKTCEFEWYMVSKPLPSLPSEPPRSFQGRQQHRRGGQWWRRWQPLTKRGLC